MTKIIETISSYGFPRIEATNDEGGRIVINDYRSESEDGMDIGMISIMNGHGLGFSNYIRSRETIDKEIDGIYRIKWIDEDTKDTLAKFLEGMRG